MFTFDTARDKERIFIYFYFRTFSNRVNMRDISRVTNRGHHKARIFKFFYIVQIILNK